MIWRWSEVFAPAADHQGGFRPLPVAVQRAGAGRLAAEARSVTASTTVSASSPPARFYAPSRSACSRARRPGPPGTRGGPPFGRASHLAREVLPAAAGRQDESDDPQNRTVRDRRPSPRGRPAAPTAGGGRPDRTTPRACGEGHGAGPPGKDRRFGRPSDHMPIRRFVRDSQTSNPRFSRSCLRAASVGPSLASHSARSLAQDDPRDSAGPFTSSTPNSVLQHGHMPQLGCTMGKPSAVDSLVLTQAGSAPASHFMPQTGQTWRPSTGFRSRTTSPENHDATNSSAVSPVFSGMCASPQTDPRRSMDGATRRSTPPHE